MTDILRSLSVVNNTSSQSSTPLVVPMQSKKILPHSRSASAVHTIRRTSGESTASRESSAAQDSTYETDTTRFQPLVSRTQSQLSQTQFSNAPYDQYASAMASMNGYGTIQGTSLDVQMQTQPQYGILNQMQNTSYYGPISSQQEVSYMPLGPQTRTGTPQLGLVSTDNDKKDKKIATTTAANEKELRELLEKNEHRNLESIARDVRQAERTQKSERAKQLFAMRWLREFCKQDSDSVPRNRVYTHYAQRCGTDRVDTLNPASFGKLVRIIFPGIQTRRLGVRGESKYHYVNLRLLDDPQATSGRPASPLGLAIHRDRAPSYEPDIDFKPASRAPIDSATFPSQEDLPAARSILSNENQSRGFVFADHDQPGIGHDDEGPHMYTQTLKFSNTTTPPAQDEAIILPSIYDFVPPGTDPDLAEALTALYRTHSTSLVDAVRYVKQKSFFRQLGSFNGTLTVPVSKLFAHHSLAPWIKLCDWLTYQQIVRFLTQLTLQVIPPQVFMMLKEVANMLTLTLRKNFQHFPSHVLHAKLEPATMFASLLQRLLRVNEAAHAAATFLTKDQVRNLMWQDWAQHVRPKRVLETELPSCGYEEAYRIMTLEMRQLLEPLHRPNFGAAGPDFQPELMATEDERLGLGMLSTADSILERWARFLEGLPARFPRAQARTILHSINAVGTAALRDITVNQAQSFGSWWITKVWVDEMMLWQAEVGGFLVPRTSSPDMESPQSLRLHKTFSASRSVSGTSAEDPQTAGLGIDFQQIPTFAPHQQTGRQSTGPPTANFSFPTRSDAKSTESKLTAQRDDNDDSGIGMSLLSNEADGMQFEFTQ